MILKPKNIFIEKIFNGCVSIRDYIVNDAILEGRTIVVHCLINGRKEAMTLTPQRLKKGFSLNGNHSILSRYSNKKYCLVDYRWVPDKQKSNESQQEFINL